MLFHALEEEILILLREPGEAERAGGTDLSLSKNRLPFCGEFLDQGDALGNPRLSVIEESGDSRNRHAVVGHQGMSDAGLVQSRDRASRTVREQQAFLVIGRCPAVFNDDGDFGTPSRAPSLETFETIDDFIAVFDGDHSKRERRVFA